LRLHRDLISLRRNTADLSRGLRGPNVTVHHVNGDAKVLAWHRWLEGGPRDDVVVLANFSANAYPDYFVGVPRPGRWRVRFNSDWDGYDPEFETVDSLDADSEAEPQDDMPQRIAVGLGPYSAVILSQDE
jgi:1,4-alpha-glucan branching enzyme